MVLGGMFCCVRNTGSAVLETPSSLIQDTVELTGQFFSLALCSRMVAQQEASEGREGC